MFVVWLIEVTILLIILTIRMVIYAFVGMMWLGALLFGLCVDLFLWYRGRKQTCGS